MDATFKNIINSIDLCPVITRLVKINYWPLKIAIAASKQYKNFLFLKKKYGAQYFLPPSLEIDEFWHNHILYTQKYHQDCLTIFGEYLHHEPHHGNNNSISQAELERLFENETQKLYLREFGEYLHEIYPKLSKGKKYEKNI